MISLALGAGEHSLGEISELIKKVGAVLFPQQSWLTKAAMYSCNGGFTDPVVMENELKKFFKDRQLGEVSPSPGLSAVPHIAVVTNAIGTGGAMDRVVVSSVAQDLPAISGYSFVTGWKLWEAARATSVCSASCAGHGERPQAELSC